VVRYGSRKLSSQGGAGINSIVIKFSPMQHEGFEASSWWQSECAVLEDDSTNVRVYGWTFAL